MIGLEYEDLYGDVACYEAVVFEIETLHCDIFRAYGRAILRAKQDCFFNKRMLDAYEKYMRDHLIRWCD